MMVIVLAFASPATLRFFESAIVLYVVPTLFLLLLFGAPVRTKLPLTVSAGIAVLIGAIGASIPEIYLCTNPHMRCFLTSPFPRETVAGAGIIVSGAACGMVFCLVYRHLKRRRSITSE